jgi:hypothetical protein
MVTPDDQRALQLANVNADERAWSTIVDLHAGTSDHERLIARAEHVKANAAAEQAKALHCTRPHRARRGRGRWSNLVYGGSDRR